MDVPQLEATKEHIGKCREAIGTADTLLTVRTVTMTAALFPLTDFSEFEEIDKRFNQERLLEVLDLAEAQVEEALAEKSGARF